MTADLVAAIDRIGSDNARSTVHQEGAPIPSFANVRNRTRVGVAVGLSLATLTALALTALPAKADTPAGYVQVGHNSDTFRNPNNPAQFVTVAVAVDLGSTDADDDVKEVFSPAGSVTARAGVIRSQVVDLRSGIGARVINDYFPSKDPLVRNNTPAGCRFVSGSTANLYDAKTPPSCANAADSVKNPLNSAADYSPDVTLVRGFGDQLRTDSQNCPTVAARVFVEVRFADNTVHAFNLRSDSGVSSDGPGCP